MGSPVGVREVSVTLFRYTPVVYSLLSSTPIPSRSPWISRGPGGWRKFSTPVSSSLFRSENRGSKGGSVSVWFQFGFGSLGIYDKDDWVPFQIQVFRVLFLGGMFSTRMGTEGVSSPGHTRLITGSGGLCRNRSRDHEHLFNGIHRFL